MIQKAGYLEKFLVLVLLLVAISCSHHTAPAFTDYDSFVSSYSKKADPIAEIYGQYVAKQSSKRVRAKYNLLLDPGQRAYIEILDPSDRLVNALSLTQKKICLLWAKDNAYIQEEATPENLKAIIGLPVNADDALQLIAGQGLQFSAWQQKEVVKNGWKLVRGPSSAIITARENLSKIETVTNQGSFRVHFEKYEFLSDKSFPTRIRFELPERKTTVELRIDKYLPRTEEPTEDLFELKLPENVKKLALNEIYHGKPLLFE
ncbi:DUF4292 domain-containing protein [bacterium]|nr:DUF4292 domain-containing protein [bacterium]MCI0604149.1 DUF4292 domain-containing protein [bacterium]